MDSSTVKTPVTVLQEFVFSMNTNVDYECITQSGPQHRAQFEYRCQACNETLTATGSTKKEAKQAVARAMLFLLAEKGHHVPSPYGKDYGLPMSSNMTPIKSGPAKCYLTLLRNMCQTYRLKRVEFEVVDEAGPPHQRQFIIKGRLGHVQRIATASTKKAAKQLVAQQLYNYLKQSFHTDSDDDEDPMMVGRYRRTSREVREHTDLRSCLNAEEQERIVTLLQAERERMEHSPERVVASAAAVMNLGIEYSELTSVDGSLSHMLEFYGCSTEPIFTGKSRAEAATDALAYMRQSILDEAASSEQAGKI